LLLGDRDERQKKPRSDNYVRCPCY
jgi:hypothetical protein